jgi:hypothetical protein
MSDQTIPRRDLQIMQMMRKTLTGIVRDTTPQPGHIHPLSESTVHDIRDCLALISARERELADELGLDGRERPFFTDEQQTAKVIPIDRGIPRRQDE